MWLSLLLSAFSSIQCYNAVERACTTEAVVKVNRNAAKRRSGASEFVPLAFRCPWTSKIKPECKFQVPRRVKHEQLQLESSNVVYKYRPRLCELWSPSLRKLKKLKSGHLHSAFSWELTSKVLRRARVNEGSHRYTCHPHECNEPSYPYFPAEAYHRTLAGFISRPAEGRRLSWSGWLITYVDGMPVQTVTHPSINRPICGGGRSNSWPLSRKSDVLTTTLPSYLDGWQTTPKKLVVKVIWPGLNTVAQRYIWNGWR